MIAIRTENLSPLFSDILGLRVFLGSIPKVCLVVSPSDGKDWDLSGSIPDDVKVFSLIPHLDRSEETIASQILTLGVQEIIPLFPVSENYESLKLGFFESFGLYNVKDVEEILNFESEKGILPDVVRISVNPLKYPKELLDYCKENKIDVIGTDIFGESLLREYYKRIFPIPFLQAFGEHNVDFLEVPGEDPYFIKEVCSRIGKGQENPKLLEYSKSIDKVPNLKIPTQKIYQTIDMKFSSLGKISIQGNGGSFSIKKKEEILDLGDPIWEDDLIPGDIDKEDKEFLGTLHRYHVLPQLIEMHSQKIWKPVFKKIYPDFWVIKMIPKGWFGWLWREYLYIMISGKLWEIPLSEHENLINV